jgi:Gpi18-like mannosyltransferase
MAGIQVWAIFTGLEYSVTLLFKGVYGVCRVIFYTLKFDCLPRIQEQLDFKELFQDALENVANNQVGINQILFIVKLINYRLSLKIKH